MGERTLRGSRLGAVSYETDRNTELAPRQQGEYLCPKGHRYTVPFAADAEIPVTWECRADGLVGKLIDGIETAMLTTRSLMRRGAHPPLCNALLA